MPWRRNQVIYWPRSPGQFSRAGLMKMSRQPKRAWISECAIAFALVCPLAGCGGYSAGSGGGGGGGSAPAAVTGLAATGANAQVTLSLECKQRRDRLLREAFDDERHRSANRGASGNGLHGQLGYERDEILLRRRCLQLVWRERGFDRSERDTGRATSSGACGADCNGGR